MHSQNKDLNISKSEDHSNNGFGLRSRKASQQASVLAAKAINDSFITSRSIHQFNDEEHINNL